MNFAFKRIYWRLLDHLRKDIKLADNCSFSLDDDQQAADRLEQCLADPASRHSFDLLDQGRWLERLWAACNFRQRCYLYACIHLDYRDSEIAEYYGVSRQAVAGWRRGVIAAARRIADHADFNYNKGHRNEG